MKKTSQRPQTSDTGGESRALYFAPWFRSGMPIIIVLAFVMAMVSISFHQSRLAMTLLNTHLPEITMAVKALDEVPNDVKLPPLGNIIHFLAIDGDEGLNILHGKRPDKAFSTISPSELSRPRLDFHAVKSALEIVTGRQNQITYVNDLPFRKDLVIGISMAELQRDLQIFFFKSFVITFLVSLGLYSFGQWLLWRFLSQPLHALVETINSFSTDPTIARPLPTYVTQSREFNKAAKAVEQMQRNTLIALRQRERLADIGEAVTKINHDIRNVLSSATLVTDALMSSDDPKVRRSAPHVVRSLEQAVDLCQSMLDYLVEVPPPKPDIIPMNEVADELEIATGMEVIYEGPSQIFADRKIMFRILLNLARNAGIVGATELKIDIWRAGHLGVIDILDNGPGISEDARRTLFQAFKTTKAGGTGLGLAIARDLAVALGGNLKLTRSNQDGSEFRLHLPKQIFLN